MRFSLVLLLMVSSLQGCASRYHTQDLPLSTVFNQYNRNFIVAKPTLVGNVICGAPTMIPLLYLTMGMARILEKVGVIKQKTGFAIVNNGSLVPAFACGLVTGTAFIPFSYLCPENPWYGSFAGVGSNDYFGSKCTDDPNNRQWQKDKAAKNEHSLQEPQDDNTPKE